MLVQCAHDLHWHAYSVLKVCEPYVRGPHEVGAVHCRQLEGGPLEVGTDEKSACADGGEPSTFTYL